MRRERVVLLKIRQTKGEGSEELSENIVSDGLRSSCEFSLLLFSLPISFLSLRLCVFFLLPYPREFFLRVSRTMSFSTASIRSVITSCDAFSYDQLRRV